MSEYPSEIIWAAAAAAQRINSGYTKQSHWDEPNEGDIVEKPSNKRLVFGFLEDYRDNKLHLLDEDYTEGKAVREYWQYQTMALLNDRTSQYIRAVVKAAHKDTIDNTYDISLIASCIEAKSRDEHRQNVLEIKSNLNSQYVYKIGDKIHINDKISVIDSKFIDRLGTSAVECIINGNLYMWWSKLHVEPGEYSNIRGRVKKLSKDYFSDTLVTQLNYVKITAKDKE